MDFSTYPWMAGSFNIGDPMTSYLDPALMGQQANIYAPASNPYAAASPLSGGVSPGMNWGAMAQGLGALGAMAGQRQGAQPMPIRPPEPAASNGRPYMAQFQGIDPRALLALRYIQLGGR